MSPFSGVRVRRVTTDPIPLATSLDSVYTASSLGQQGERWNTLAEEFDKEFGAKPQHVARAPGRVNILGEHIDYSDFSVLPAAIERDVLIAFSVSAPSSSFKPSAPGKTVVVLRNHDSKYSPTEFEVDLSGSGDELAMPEKHHWSSYFIAGTKGILAHLNARIQTSKPSVPAVLSILVWGTVPEGSGLSSSSAMTTASAITILTVMRRREGLAGLERKEVTQVAIESERLVGVNSGGMDQAASVFSQPLHLLHIEFVRELAAKPIPLPTTRPPFSFVIANTLVTSNKQLTAKFCYNLRVAETRLGALLLAQHLNLPASLKTYKQIVDHYFSLPTLHPETPDQLPKHLPPVLPTAPALPSSPLPPKVDKNLYELKTVMGLVIQALGGPGMETGLTWDEVAKKLGRDRDELEKSVVGDSEVEPVDGKLKIWMRARHVFSEALRVYEFIDLLQAANADDTTIDSSTLLDKMGELMNASMSSCQTDYECSCPELDELVGLARSNGALGSRVTGAGWGGATVSLVPEPEVASFIKALKEGYYAKKFPNLTPEELEDVIFATKPEAGAGVFAFEE